MSRVILIGFDSVKINTDISDIILTVYSDEYPEDFSMSEKIYLAYKQSSKADLIIVNSEQNYFSDLEQYILNVAFINNIPIFGCGKKNNLSRLIKQHLLNDFPTLDEALEHFKLYYVI
jgi:hypothetical protein